MTEYVLNSLGNNIYNVSEGGVVYKFDISDVGNGKYYADDVELGNLVYFQGGNPWQYYLSNHEGVFTHAPSDISVYNGTLPFVANTNTSDIDLDSKFDFKNLTDNIVEALAKRFKLKGTDFDSETDENGVPIFSLKSSRILEIAQEITVDLTNITNTSLNTQTLTASTSSIGAATGDSLEITTLSVTQAEGLKFKGADGKEYTLTKRV